MEIRQGCNKLDFKSYDTDRIRKEFLIDGLFVEGKSKYVYSHIDRIIVVGVCPTAKPIALESGDILRSKFFLERREMGIINIGGAGQVTVDGVKYDLGRFDCLYVGRGTKEVLFASVDPKSLAKFYCNSVPAHKAFPCTLVGLDKAIKVDLGSKAECNERTINKYILPGGVDSCQLVMGLTILKEGSVWNTMPTHTHERRMEVYLYFDVKPDNVVFHLMGDPGETRHAVIANEQAVISPSFSIHSGCGTSNYSFIWGMCGENQEFDDMDKVAMNDIR